MDILALYQRYGDVVRVAPDELAFRDSRAWKDIYGHRTDRTGNNAVTGEMTKNPKMTKDPKMYASNASSDQPENILTAFGCERHGLLRKSVAHRFSDRSLREQQPYIKGYVDLLVEKLREKRKGGRATVDMARCE